jgi:hypothetical protein
MFSPHLAFIYIYIYRERERERERGSCGLMGFFWITYLLQYSEPVLTLAKVKGGHSYKHLDLHSKPCSMKVFFYVLLFFYFLDYFNVIISKIFFKKKYIILIYLKNIFKKKPLPLAGTILIMSSSVHISFLVRGGPSFFYNIYR